MNILRRLPLSRLLLLCGLVVALGACLTALASALGSGPTPAPKPLANAVHDALTAAPVEGVSASVQLTDHLLEGASLTSSAGEAGQLTANPLLSGASGRLWIARHGRVRLELQSEKGDTQVLYDGHTLSLYDASTNTLYRYTPPGTDHTSGRSSGGDEVDMAAPAANGRHHEVPTVGKIEEAIAHLKAHANVSHATPTDVAGQAAYTVRVSPSEGGSLFGGAELSWDAVHGVPLRAAVFSSTSPAPVLELAATDISYGPVPDSVFEFTPPPNAKIEEVQPSASPTDASPNRDAHGAERPKVTVHGHGVSAVDVLEANAKEGAKQPLSGISESLPKVTIGGTTATELPTALGTLLSFERSGVRYLLVGSVTPAALEAVARGL